MQTQKYSEGGARAHACKLAWHAQRPPRPAPTDATAAAPAAPFSQVAETDVALGQEREASQLARAETELLRAELMAVRSGLSAAVRGELGAAGAAGLNGRE